uniref:Uncharacterized protein n=1 Tax=Ananas comosus var. bracteatus TaxID=296719 RepID=A0A6V7QP44_ANACO|nr:unnamed protein product [Ananas comosus var. bracteatus]
MFSKLFGGCRDESPVSSSQQLKQVLEVLGQKEITLQKKIDIEVERAKEFTRARNKQAAFQCLKRKKYYEGQMERLGSFQQRVHDQEQKLSQKSAVQCKQVQQIASNVRNNLEKI